MTVNPAVPEPAAAPATPVRGSRGRHAGPAVAQPTGADLRAAAAGRVRRMRSVLAANPLDDITNTRSIVTIFHDGRTVAPRVPVVMAR